jgi:AsmA protein
MIGVVKSTLGQQTKSAAAPEQDKKTEFAEFIVTGIFEKGILKSDDLMIRSLLLTATGKGSINLVNETINYVLNPVLGDDTGIEGLGQLSGVPIPIKITGNMYEPDFSLGVVAGLTGSQKAKLDEKKDELANKLLGEVFGSKKDKKKKKKDR